MNHEDLARLMRRSETAEAFFRAATEGLQMTATSRTGTVYAVQFTDAPTVYELPFEDEAVNATFFMYRATTKYTNGDGADREVVGFAGLDPLTGGGARKHFLRSGVPPLPCSAYFVLHSSIQMALKV